MYFDELIGLKERTNQPIIFREAVRAICFKDGKILMIHSNEGDYKHPGGGIEKNESNKEALMREIAEETGYECTKVGKLIGKILQRKEDMFEENKLFEMVSYYYICQVGDTKGKQKLSRSERLLDFKPIWINIKEAISKNEEFLNNLDKNDVWTTRENYVLKKIEEIGIDNIVSKH